LTISQGPGRGKIIPGRSVLQIRIRKYMAMPRRADDLYQENLAKEKSEGQKDEKALQLKKPKRKES